MDNADLSERLKRLGVSQGVQALRPKSRIRTRSIEELLSGEVVDTDQGSYFLHRESYELEHCHGHHALSALLAHDPASPARLARDERLAEVDLRRVAFVDTETTGLAGGTGTYAFLVGVGVFEEERFTVHQFFMRDYNEELAQLHGLGQLLDGLEALVSFNGKNFDLPLLETRFLMTRQMPRLTDAPHLDLLPTARRFWKYRLDSCALSRLEAEILGVKRTQADVPGWMIPGLYQEYVRSGDAGEMPRIFYHNVQDILSLVTLAARQCDLLALALPSDLEVPGEDLYGLGRVLQELNHPDRAEAAYAQAAQTCRSPHVREMAMRDLAYSLKRRQQWAEALGWWRQLVEVEGAVYACEELAKYYEWHDPDLAEAMIWTQKGIGLAQTWPRGARRREALAQLQHRLQRLEQKARTASSG
jgi:uncharacterized protein YprB with RNaseH-like and TPR domain